MFSYREERERRRLLTLPPLEFERPDCELPPCDALPPIAAMRLTSDLGIVSKPR